MLVDSDRLQLRRPFERQIDPVEQGLGVELSIAGWLKRLRDDRKLLIHAAAQAQHAADYILGGNTAA